MQVVQDQGVTTPTAASPAAVIDAGTRKGFTWTLYMFAADAFGFEVGKADGEPVETSGGYKSQGKAGRAAEELIDRLAAEADEARRFDIFGKALDGNFGRVAAGWAFAARLERNDYLVEFVNAETREWCQNPPELKGYMHLSQALVEAEEWALANPANAPAPETVDPPFEPTGDVEVAPADPPAPAPETPAPEPTAEQLAAEADATMAEVAAAEPPATVVMYDERVDEVWTLIDQRRNLRERRASLLGKLDLVKSQLKAVGLEIEEIDAQIDAAQADSPRQRTLPLAPAPRPVDQAKVAAEATKIADALKPGEVAWAFNGVDHVIKVHEHAPGWRAFLKGHEDRTEGLGPTYDEAVEACKTRASIVFEDAEPGSTAIPDPPKRGRGRKKSTEEQPPPAEESADAPQVIAALRSSMNLDEAAERLKVTTATLQKWCAENGVSASEHLCAETGGDEPVSKTSKRGSRRGRKGK